MDEQDDGRQLFKLRTLGYQVECFMYVASWLGIWGSVADGGDGPTVWGRAAAKDRHEVTHYITKTSTDDGLLHPYLVAWLGCMWMPMMSVIYDAYWLWDVYDVGRFMWRQHPVGSGDGDKCEVKMPHLSTIRRGCSASATWCSAK